jgi:hypothetical protein
MNDLMCRQMEGSLRLRYQDPRLSENKYSIFFVTHVTVLCFSLSSLGKLVTSEKVRLAS